MHAVLEAVRRRISREIHGLDAEAAQTSPNEDAQHWSSQQVIEHLVLSYRSTAQSLESRLAKGRIARDQKRSAVQWILQLMILTFGHIPRGMPALDETIPAPGGFQRMDGEDLNDLLRRELDAMDAVLDRCRRKFGMERVAAHPLLGPMRVDQWRRFHAVHGIHHSKQVKRLRQHAEPRAAAGRVRNVTLTKELQIPAHRSLT